MTTLPCPNHVTPSIVKASTVGDLKSRGEAQPLALPKLLSRDALSRSYPS